MTDHPTNNLDTAKIESSTTTDNGHFSTTSRNNKYNSSAVDTSTTKTVKASGGKGFAVLNLVLILALAGGGGMYIWQQNKQLSTLANTLSTTSSELTNTQSQMQAVLQATSAQTQSNADRLVLVDAKFAEFEQQQVALQDIYQSLASNADNRLLTDVEQSLVIASQQLQLAGNINNALSALDVAYERLSQSQRSDLSLLKAAIERDRARLASTPTVDIVTLINHLDQVLIKANRLPMVDESIVGSSNTQPQSESETLTQAEATDSTVDASWLTKAKNLFDQFKLGIVNESKNIIEIQKVSNSDALFLNQEQKTLIRNNIQLRLLTARYALVARNKDLLTQDLDQVDLLLNKYFDMQSEEGVAILKELALLRGTDFKASIPDINDSLRAVRFEQSRQVTR